MGVLAAVLAHAGDVALDVAGLQIGFVEGRVEQLDDLLVAPHQALVDRRHRLAGAHRIAAPEMTAQLWLIESIWHSSLLDEPSGVPSSNQARRYQAPSQAWASMLLRSCAACGAAQLGKGRRRRGHAPGRQTAQILDRNHASHTLSPLPSLPTRFMPSFQSPQPISGN
jgi:hypothetical protein